MPNQYTNPTHHNYRYLGNLKWERVDPYKIPESFLVLHATDDFRRFIVYYFFRMNDGKLFSDPEHNSCFPEIDVNGLQELPVGSVVRVYRDWAPYFTDEKFKDKSVPIINCPTCGHPLDFRVTV